MVTSFAKWFFAAAPRGILQLGGNFLAWGWHFFSIGYLPPRLFSAWHRDITPYGRGFDFKKILHILGWNLISRVIGAILRLFVICAGLIIEASIALAAASFFVFWYLIPAIVVLLVVFGLLVMF